jgi:hypothetical protein
MTKDTVNIHGKQYETVASRVSRFRDEYKQELAIVTELIDRDAETVVMKASIVKGDQILATGYAEESRTSSTINRTSALENCETSAIGRALAAFGMAGTEYASADEVAQAISKQNVHEPTNSNPSPSNGLKAFDLKGEATDKQKDTISKSLNRIGVIKEDQKGYLIEQYGVEFPLSKQVASELIEDLFNQSTYKGAEPVYAGDGKPV